VREAELQRAIAEAHALREEMRTSDEELRSTNEELQSTNEELQSANEELTTSKEEMQAMNEELQTVNAELMSRLEDLAVAQSDLKNLLNSTQIATLFLDGRLNVRRFTEQARRVISLRENDIGRPLADLVTRLQYPELGENIAAVLRTLEPREREIRTTEGAWYAVRIMPYRTQDNVIDGVVLTFIDISTAKALEARLRAAPPAG
jgi:two-component system, chemotaxis family, CheB/CheR fusion protein